MKQCRDVTSERLGASRRMAAMAVLLLSLALSGCSGMGGTAEKAYDWLEASRPEAATQLTLPFGKQQAAVELDFPQGYNTQVRRFPLCLVLRSEETPLLPDMRRAAYQKGFVLALATLPARDSEALLPFVDELLEQLRMDYAVDPRRITLYGRGQDAQLAAGLVCERSHRFAGLGLVDGGTPPAGCRPVKPIPVIVLAESEDAVGGVASFWAHNNGCEPLPDKSVKEVLVRERYRCPQPQSSVQRYSLRPAVTGGEPYEAFPAAWTLFEFLKRQSDY